MKQFVVQLSDKQRDLMTKELIIGHVNHLRSLKEKGVLPFCGPCYDGSALMIIKASDIEEARAYVEADPFAKANYYKSRNIVEVEEATIENNFLLEDVIEYLEG